jgi:hypothetical protein
MFPGKPLLKSVAADPLGAVAPHVPLRITDALLLALLAVLGLTSAMHGFDAAELIRADALYPIQLLDFSPLDFRPPPPNRLFPDVIVHALLAWTGDPLTQKIVAGLVLFAMTVIAVGLVKGPVVFGAVVVALAAGGFAFVDSACHYTLPLLVLLVQIARPNRTLEGIALALAVFSNMLVLIPLMVLLLDPAGASRFKTRAAIAAMAFGAAALYADFGVSVVQLAVILPLWAAVLLVAQRYGLREALLLAITVALIAGAVAGLVPGRYALPVAAALIVVLAHDVTRATSIVSLPRSPSAGSPTSPPSIGRPSRSISRRASGAAR